ncbi:hypothetical protein [Haloarchaeobius iranensis]|uniref:Uncharacterized protein n=1 Tax=Haloarchaeobius iranensis TaxID=996166 RepID=A0A1H0BAM0_9EURY|nr:hypothetical protein [Haloarchaeobius iranensis]SDN42678.1 hypothetical protein SAMN05192554_13611 [Haloarchaeobius iranensis]
MSTHQSAEPGRIVLRGFDPETTKQLERIISKAGIRQRIIDREPDRGQHE